MTNRSALQRPIIATVLALALLSGFSFGSSGSAGATTASYVVTPNGMVGVPQTITIAAPPAAGRTVTVGLLSGPAAFTTQTTLGAAGEGSIAWTPTAAGTWTISGLGSIIAAGSTTITIAPMPTYTVLLAQNHLQEGVSNSLLGVVVAPIGVLPPMGTLALSTSTGNAISSATLASTTGTASTSSLIAGATATSSSSLPWTPTSSGDIPIKATYAPSSGGQLASVSSFSTPNTTTANATVSVRWPAALYAGSPTVVQAVLGQSMPDGSVAFLIDGSTPVGSSPTVDGVASQLVTMPASGVHTISVEYTGKNPGFSGTATQPVFVLGARPTDSIVVTPAGQGPWSVALPITMSPGQSMTLSGTSASGTSVLLSASGDCFVNGSVLTALAAGECLVTAISPGDAANSPGSATYTVSVVAASASASGAAAKPVKTTTRAISLEDQLRTLLGP
ncbi:MAG: hypothetical protein ACOYO9_10505 [Candidatus Nanopelagicales bacterium]